ncbi:MAG: hypothetical protein WDZ88_03385 [Candidatus Paceibacterota bacterium]
MTNKLHKTIILTIVILAIFFCVRYIVYVFAPKPQAHDAVSVPDDEWTWSVPRDEWTWSVYEDTEFNFRISYLSHLSEVHALDLEQSYSPSFATLVKDIGFGTNGLGLMGVKIHSDVSLDTVDNFLQKRHDERYSNSRAYPDGTGFRYEKEAEFLIDDTEVTVFHGVSIGFGPNGQEEHFRSTKYALFVKDDMLFEIWSRFGDQETHEHVWKSIEFIEDENKTDGSKKN